MDAAPMMANPSDYHTMMYEFFYNGNAPEVRKDEEGKVVSTKKAIPKATQDEFAELLAMQQDPERQAKRAAALEAKMLADAEAERQRLAVAE